MGERKKPVCSPTKFDVEGVFAAAALVQRNPAQRHRQERKLRCVPLTCAVKKSKIRKESTHRQTLDSIIARGYIQRNARGRNELQTREGIEF